MSSLPIAIGVLQGLSRLNVFKYLSPAGVPPVTTTPYRPPNWSKGPQPTSITVVQKATGSTVEHRLTAPDGTPISGNSTTPTNTQLTPPASTTYFFDAVISADHYTALRLTEHPVQSGASITDHAYAVPARVVLEIGMSDVMDSFVHGQYATSKSKSVSAYQTFVNIQKSRLPLQLTTHLQNYATMLIEDIRAADTNATFTGLKATIVLREIILATVSTTTVSARPDQSGITNKGTVQPAPVDPATFTSHVIIPPTSKLPPTNPNPQWNSNALAPGGTHFKF
jgi:hypothetical protein